MLLILTDGVISDMDATKEAIVQVSTTAYNASMMTETDSVYTKLKGILFTHVYRHYWSRSSRFYRYCRNQIECVTDAKGAVIVEMTILDGDFARVESRGRKADRDIVQVIN